MSTDTQRLVNQLEKRVAELSQTLAKTEQELARLTIENSQAKTKALENASLLSDTQTDLHETHLMPEISRRLAAASTIAEVRAALGQSAVATGADRCVLYICEELDSQNIPTYGQISFVSDDQKSRVIDDVHQRFLLSHYDALYELVQTQETMVIENIGDEARLSPKETDFLQQFGAGSLVINPLVTRTHIIGLLTIEYEESHHFTERELALYQTLCHQTSVALESARQIQRTEEALAETQTLYRAGRVLAGADDLQEILQESLVEFVYSLGLDQGGVTLITPDRSSGQLMAYLEKGALQSIDQLQFPVNHSYPYQRLLFEGQPFVSSDVANDPRLEGFITFNKDHSIKSMLQAPMIIGGRTIGWIGADSVKAKRLFVQREIDLARAMADQIAITIQNRRLLEQTELRANRLRAVATVGEIVAGLNELEDVLNTTVDLIRNRFGFYHVSIFLLDETDTWAVVRASTGEVGQIMVERPHRLGVGSNSIVGYVTKNAVPRIASDVGDDAVHFQNPLLPDTRSEMALPLILGGNVIGALDVQSVESNAFFDEDIEILEIMANQITTAIANARLFEETRRTLERTQTLYRISDALATAVEPQIIFEIVLGEYLKLLDLKQGSLMLYDQATQTSQAKARYVDSQPVTPDLTLPIEDDLVFQYLTKHPEPLVIEEVKNHPLIKPDHRRRDRDRLTGVLLVPLLARQQLIGTLVLDVLDDERAFSSNDINIGETIADQLVIWLENRRLLSEAQYRSNRLQTAAEISRAASSILDIDELIKTSVNLIRDQFDFYYVGLFLVDDAQEWAVLQAGTGEAGRTQLEGQHRLKIGGESMIGWSIANRQARIALDVGKDAVRFVNPILPDTRSEMALPLISREASIGALTVQSAEQGAFSGEDITMLQTMADQLANAIANASLYENAAQARHEAEVSLQETRTLQQLSEALSGTLLINEVTAAFFEVCARLLNFDFVIISLIDRNQERIKSIDGFNVAETYLKQIDYPLDQDNILTDIIKSGRTMMIDHLEHRADQENIETIALAEWGVRVLTPITLRQENIGVVEAGFNRQTGKNIQDSQVKLLRAFIDQTALALESAQRYEATQRTARREQIIREITGKIRNNVDVNDILKTTVSELSKVVGASRGRIMLGTESNPGNRRGDGQDDAPSTDTAAPEETLRDR